MRDNTDFAKRLALKMVKRGLIASALATKIWGREVSSEGKNVAKGRDRISVWLAGINFPSQNNLVKLARALDVEISDLVPNAEIIQTVYRRKTVWDRNRLAAWMHDHCLDGEEPYQ